MGLKLLVCMECNFFGNIVNSVNFQDAGICPVRKTELKTSSSAIKYSSGAAFNNSAVRPQSSDALLNFNRLIACIRSARVHVGFWIQYRWQTWWLCKWSNKQCFQHGGKFIHRWLLYTTSSRWSRQSFSQRFPTWKGFMPQYTVWRALAHGNHVVPLAGGCPNMALFCAISCKQKFCRTIVRMQSAESLWPVLLFDVSPASWTKSVSSSKEYGHLKANYYIVVEFWLQSWWGCAWTPLRPARIRPLICSISISQLLPWVPAMSRVPLSNDLVAKAFPGFQRTMFQAS